MSQCVLIPGCRSALQQPVEAAPHAHSSFDRCETVKSSSVVPWKSASRSPLGDEIQDEIPLLPITEFGRKTSCTDITCQELSEIKTVEKESRKFGFRKKQSLSCSDFVTKEAKANSSKQREYLVAVLMYALLFVTCSIDQQQAESSIPMQVHATKDYELCWRIEVNTASCSLNEWVFVSGAKQGCPAIGMVMGVVNIAGIIQSRIELRWEGIVSHVYRETVLLSLETTPTVEVEFNGVNWSIEYDLSFPMTLELNRASAQKCEHVPNSDSRKKLCRSLALDRQFDLLDLRTLNLNEDSWRRLLQTLVAK